MEDLELETLNPSQNPPFAFPRLRRRPLQSETYRTFFQIISHCNALQSLPQHHTQEVAELNASLSHNNSEPEGLLNVQQKPAVEETKEHIGFQDGDFNGKQMEVDSLDPMDMLAETNGKLMEDNNVNHVDSFMTNIQTIDSVTDMINDLKDSCTVVGPKEISPVREQEEVDKQAFLHEVSEAVNSSLDMDMVVELSRPIEHSHGKNSTAERNLSEGIEHELQLKEKELEKLISTSGAMDSSLCLTDSDIEEGEISGDIGVYYEAMNFLSDDAVSFEEKKAEDLQVCRPIVDREELTRVGGESRHGKHDISSSQSVDNVDIVNDIVKLGRQSTRKDPKTNFEMFPQEGDIEIEKAKGHDSILETEQISEQVGGARETDHVKASSKYLPPYGEIKFKDTKEKKELVTAEKDADVGQKKKRGPLSKERKAKKKQKERIKRAEKNRKLGVKRLKLQPVLKPKKVTYCRHYLKGRCQEGEKCKFSHDTTPLTKSKPCCHFARHSCMKGDDCPFDHQLSKYPCNNYVTKGFCSRGADCLFSHEIPATEGPLMTSNFSKPELKSPILMIDSNSIKQVNIHGNTHQQFDAKLCNIENSSGKNTEKKVAEDIQRPAARVPKGIRLFSHVRSSPGNTSKHEETALPLMRHDGVRVGPDPITSSSDSIQKSNEIAKGAPMRTPKGVNFLSFGKVPSDDTGSNKDHGIGESFLGELNKTKLFGSPLKGDSGFQIEKPSGQSLWESEPNKNKMANLISPASTRFVALAKVPLDNSSAVGQDGLLRHNVQSNLLINQEREIALGLKSSTTMPSGLTSSSNPFRQSLEQSGPGNSAGMSRSLLKTSFLPNTPNSMQKALQSTLAFAAKFDSQIKLN